MVAVQEFKRYHIMIKLVAGTDEGEETSRGRGREEGERDERGEEGVITMTHKPIRRYLRSFIHFRFPLHDKFPVIFKAAKEENAQRTQR